MEPPGTIVVPQMVIGVGLIHSNGEFLITDYMGLFHGAYRLVRTMFEQPDKEIFEQSADFGLFVEPHIRVVDL
jgi:hypothetical protein